MADLLEHLNQANHNEQCANEILAQIPQFRDWAITSSFYSAVHLAEAMFTSVQEIGHSESARDRASNEELHRYRSRKVLELARPAYTNYRKLHEASQNVRYLAGAIPGGQRFSLSYYSANDVDSMVHVELPQIRSDFQAATGINLS